MDGNNCNTPVNTSGTRQSKDTRVRAKCEVTTVSHTLSYLFLLLYEKNAW